MGLGMSVPAVTGGTGQGWCLVAPGDSSRAWTVSCQVMVDTELWKLKRPPRGPAGRGRILYTVKQPAAVLGLVSGGRRLRCRPDRRPAGSGRTGGCHGGTGGTGHRRRRDQRRQTHRGRPADRRRPLCPLRRRGLVLSTAGASELAREPAARDFVTDAYAHCKFIGYTGDAAPLLDATGVSELRDDGFIELSGNGSAASFISACRQLRFWEREAAA
jgi:C-terminal domain found in long catalases